MSENGERTTVEEIKEAIREGRRVARLRMGQDAPTFETLKSNPEVRVALVPLTEKEYEIGLEMSAAIEAPNNLQGVELRDRYQQVCDLFHAIRNPSDLGEKVFKSPEELVGELDQIDVNHLGEMYMRMVDYSSPAIDELSDEDLDELKKAFANLDLSVLSGKPWWHLKNFFSTLSPMQLRGKLPGSFSTTTSIGTKDKEESIPGV